MWTKLGLRSPERCVRFKWPIELASSCERRLLCLLVCGGSPCLCIRSAACLQQQHRSSTPWVRCTALHTVNFIVLIQHLESRTDTRSVTSLSVEMTLQILLCAAYLAIWQAAEMSGQGGISAQRETLGRWVDFEAPTHTVPPPVRWHPADRL